MRIKEFIQFIELLLNELLQSKRILAFPNESNFGKAKVTSEMQRENFIFFYFNTVTMFAAANDKKRQARHRSRGLRAPCREALPRCFS
jgi:hypothetical protein